MKKIIINGRFLSHRIAGVERYAREIISGSDDHVRKDEIIIAIPPDVKATPQYKNIKKVRIGKLHGHFWEHISFPLYVWKQKGISLNLCNSAPLSSPGIVCIHDMKIKAAPQYFALKFLLWYNMLFYNAAKRAKIIITVSEFSKTEIIKYYRIHPEKVFVVSNAWQHYECIGYDEDALIKYDIEKEKYYFSISSLEPNKNLKWIAEVAKRNPDQTFAVAGSINKKIFKDGLGFMCPPNMRLLGYISDKEAKTLMRGCKAFLFPTFYEGFGIPPLEAVSAGAKEIIVSDTPVMHEIFGHCANYISPDSYDVKINEMRSIKEKERQSVLGKYSWEGSAKKLRDILIRYV